MFIHQTMQPLPLLVVIATILVLQTNYYCFCMNSINGSDFPPVFNSGIATWYGDPTGPGSTGGACGYGVDVANAPYNALISAGNPNIYQSGKGCGACYQVKCTQNPACSGFPVTVTITDECPGCTDNAFHFDLSGKAFGFLAKPGQADALRGAGLINIQYKRVQCRYNASIRFKIDSGSNAYYLAFVVEYTNGAGSLGNVELLPSGFNSSSWIPMQQLWGETWKTLLPNRAKGPFSVRLTTALSKVVAQNVIPFDWVPGKHYTSNVNF